MSESFVYPAYKSHKPYRELTRDHDMIVIKGHVWHQPKNVPPNLVFAEGVPYWADKQESVDHWFLHELGGINLCNPYLGMHIGRPRGLRLCLGVHPKHSSVAQAYELLSFGIGIFRPAQTRQREDLLLC